LAHFVDFDILNGLELSYECVGQMDGRTNIPCK